jgi:hypothetical protein
LAIAGVLAIVLGSHEIIIQKWNEALKLYLNVYSFLFDERIDSEKVLMERNYKNDVILKFITNF